MRIKVAIVDDHPIVIDGLKLLLSKEEFLDIVFTTTDGFELLNYIETNSVDILLTDIVMPNMSGLELGILVRKKNAAIHIIALSMNGEGAIISDMINQANIKGYLLKTSNREQLVNAIVTVANGGNSFDDEVLLELTNFDNINIEKQQIHLTAREIEIIKLIAMASNNKQIAQLLFISERTVETHRKNIFRKTNTHSVVSLLEYIRKLKIIE